MVAEHAGEARFHADEAFFSPLGSPQHKYHMAQAERIPRVERCF